LRCANAVGAFNNGGFNWRSNGLLPYVDDPLVCLPIAVGFIAGGLGFPVLIELRREIRPRAWSLHTKLTLTMTGALLILGPSAVTAFEWTNPRTLGPLDVAAKLLAGFFQGVTPRTAGFVTLDYVAMEETTWLATDVMMFIGGGSASTAGGIKVTTFVVLLLAIIAEVRGHAEAEFFNRAIAPAVIRQAMTVALLGVAVVTAGTALLLAITGLDLDRVLFEAISAFSTSGLSTGITTQLSGSAQLVLVVMMFLGRVGTVTLASALALRSRQRLYRLPEGRPIVG
jgi:trk system potassium uptake protein